MKRRVIIAILFIGLFRLFGQNGESDINRINHFNFNESGDYYYFSFLNPNYTVDRYKRYIFNCSKEVIKFLKMNLRYTAGETKYGSFALNQRKVTITVDTNLVFDFIDYLEPVQLDKTPYGDVLTLKISKDNLEEVWAKYNDHSMPFYSSLSIDSSLIKGIPSWFYELPRMDGYLFGVGMSSRGSTTQKNFVSSDYYAIVEIINNININVNTTLKSYLDDNINLQYFFHDQASEAYISGIYIVRRYYDAKTKTAYSLAVLKYK